MYQKPVILVNDDLAEGVYAASGDCYTATAYIHQYPDTGRETYKIQVNGAHKADHVSEGQELVITFNQPVTYVMSAGTLKSGDGTATLHVSYRYHNNETDNIGLGDLEVRSDGGLAIVSTVLLDVDKR